MLCIFYIHHIIDIFMHLDIFGKSSYHTVHSICYVLIYALQTFFFFVWELVMVYLLCTPEFLVTFDRNYFFCFLLNIHLLRTRQIMYLLYSAEV